MSDKGKSISIIGCCTSRDIFGLHENDGGYHIKRFVQNISPISAVTKSPLMRELTIEDDTLFAGTSPFFKKCQKLELEKKVWNYIAEDKADYLVIDMAEFRRKLFYFHDNDGWFSENYYLKELFENYMAFGIIPEKYEIVSPLDIGTNQCEQLLTGYFERLREIYPPNKIILVDVRAGGHHIIDDDKLCIAEKQTANIFNSRIAYAFNKAKNSMPSVHVVEFPSNVSIDKNHKWGRNLLHFVNEYYDYALKAVDVITSGSFSFIEEMKKIEELKKECEERIAVNYGSLI